MDPSKRRDKRKMRDRRRRDFGGSPACSKALKLIIEENRVGSPACSKALQLIIEENRVLQEKLRDKTRLYEARCMDYRCLLRDNEMLDQTNRELNNHLRCLEYDNNRLETSLLEARSKISADRILDDSDRAINHKNTADTLPTVKYQKRSLRQRAKDKVDKDREGSAKVKQDKPKGTSDRTKTLSDTAEPKEPQPDRQASSVTLSHKTPSDVPVKRKGVDSNGPSNHTDKPSNAAGRKQSPSPPSPQSQSKRQADSVVSNRKVRLDVPFKPDEVDSEGPSQRTDTPNTAAGHKREPQRQVSSVASNQKHRGDVSVKRGGIDSKETVQRTATTKAAEQKQQPKRQASSTASNQKVQSTVAVKHEGGVGSSTGLAKSDTKERKPPQQGSGKHHHQRQANGVDPTSGSSVVTVKCEAAKEPTPCKSRYKAQDFRYDADLFAETLKKRLPGENGKFNWKKLGYHSGVCFNSLPMIYYRDAPQVTYDEANQTEGDITMNGIKGEAPDQDNCKVDKAKQQESGTSAHSSSSSTAKSKKSNLKQSQEPMGSGVQAVSNEDVLKNKKRKVFGDQAAQSKNKRAKGRPHQRSALGDPSTLPAVANAQITEGTVSKGKPSATQLTVENDFTKASTSMETPPQGSSAVSHDEDEKAMDDDDEPVLNTEWGKSAAGELNPKSSSLVAKRPERSPDTTMALETSTDKGPLDPKSPRSNENNPEKNPVATAEKPTDSAVKTQANSTLLAVKSETSSTEIPREEVTPSPDQQLADPNSNMFTYQCYVEGCCATWSFHAGECLKLNPDGRTVSHEFRWDRKCYKQQVKAVRRHMKMDHPEIGRDQWPAAIFKKRD